MDVRLSTRQEVPGSNPGLRSMDFNFTPKSHYPSESYVSQYGTTHNGLIGQTATVHLPLEAWYDRTKQKRGINKIFGATMDRKLTINSSGIWNHRNSVRLGWEPDRIKGFFEVFLYLHLDGKPYVPKPISLINCGTVVDTASFNCGWYFENGFVYGWTKWINHKGSEHYAFKKVEWKGRPIGAGYHLGPYHGGENYPLENYTLKFDLINNNAL